MAMAPQVREPEKKKERPSALRSIIAGSTAGAVEIGTYSSNWIQRAPC
jgi:solute carrier family 25 citrate transporter 1